MTTKTVLIVEDSLPVREFIADSVLGPAGFATLVAADGAEGLQIAREARPDLIITDWQMPDLDGLAMVRQLQSEALCPPVILISVEGSEALTVEALEAGVAEFLVKPFEAEELLAAVHRILSADEDPAESAWPNEG